VHGSGATWTTVIVLFILRQLATRPGLRNASARQHAAR
jgi:hypothetical protein